MLTCCLCESWRGRSYEDLAAHLVGRHGHSRDNGQPPAPRGGLYVLPHYRMVRCWCGGWFELALLEPPCMTTFGDHLKERGGLADHLLEATLGLCDN